MSGGTARAIRTHYEVRRIPLACRILRVADSYAALTDARPFRAAHSSAWARSVNLIVDAAGIEFDPRVVQMFLLIDSIPELESFASQAPELVEKPPEPERDLFASFMK